MGQIHKRFTSRQIKFLLQACLGGNIKRPEVREVLGVSKTRSFALLEE